MRRIEADNSATSQTSYSTSLIPTIENVLPFYLGKAKAGQRVCLVTLYNVDTVAPRPAGSQIAVAEDGESFGFITGGCAEAAIVHEALMALKENQSRTIRIGSDSPWFDIKLPCGAGIDLHFSVNNSTSVIEAACDQLLNRETVSLAIDTKHDKIAIIADRKQSHTCGEVFVREYLPQARLAIIGAGPYVTALTALAKQSEFEVVVWSPEQDASVELADQRIVLGRKTLLQSKLFDPHTAVVLLFHEHDWEPKLLTSVLTTDCFFIGALGSKATHAARLQRLREYGISEIDLERISGPVGIAIEAKTPAEIAVSILAEVVQVKNSR